MSELGDVLRKIADAEQKRAWVHLNPTEVALLNGCLYGAATAIIEHREPGTVEVQRPTRQKAEREHGKCPNKDCENGWVGYGVGCAICDGILPLGEMPPLLDAIGESIRATTRADLRWADWP